ncbi:MAG TPA: hypothetical protein VK966_02305 [Longimicrobiales bacterium]|nr:hypothetical protein [Longimicrobiales bacterium]
MMVRGSRMAVLTLALGLVLGACDDDDSTAPPIGTPWGAELAEEAGSGVTGLVSAEAFDDEFDVEVAIVDAAEDETYTWYVGEGEACSDDADRLGDGEDYPSLEPDAEGEAAASASVTGVLADDGEYHVAVWADGAEELVACGQLVQD